MLAYQPKARWYGAPILVADASVIAIGAFVPLSYGNSSDTFDFAPWSLFSSLATGPIVHLVNDDPGLCFASLGIRSASLLAGFFAGVVAAGDSLVSDGGEFGIIWYAVNSLFMASASTLDATVLAWRRTAKSPLVARPPLPWVRPAQGGAVIGIGGVL